MSSLFRINTNNVLKKFCITTGLLVTMSLLAIAHEFWIQPDRFFANAGDAVRLTVRVGEHFNGDRWGIRKSRIVTYQHLSARGSSSLVPADAAEELTDAELTLAQPGTHLISLFTTNRYLEMRADSFLLYLKEDGLDDVISAREQRGETSRRSRELYRRCVKTLIQAGNQPDDTYARNTGMPLEIIPTQNPYSQKPGQPAEFRILFNGQPLAGALVRYWNRDAANHLTEEQQRSDAQGHVQFRLRAGSNMVSLVKMVPHTDKAAADWQSYWGSLTFGCR